LEFKYHLQKISHNPIEWDFFHSELDKLSIQALYNHASAVLMGGDGESTELARKLFKVYRDRVTDLFSLCIPEQIEKMGRTPIIEANDVPLRDVTAFIHLKGKPSIFLFQSMDKTTARTWMTNLTGGIELQGGDGGVGDGMAESLNIATGRSLPGFSVPYGPHDISIPFTVYSDGLTLKSPNSPMIIENLESDNTKITLGIMVLKPYEEK
jgi:CheY-specific phosphatase CheX